MAHFREVLYLPFEGDKICTISARPQERGRYPTVVLRSPYETEHENDTGPIWSSGKSIRSF